MFYMKIVDMFVKLLCMIRHSIHDDYFHTHYHRVVLSKITSFFFKRGHYTSVQFILNVCAFFFLWHTSNCVHAFLG